MTDTGSWVLVGRYLLPYTREGRESWCGLSTDISKLPHTGVTGSTAYCIDTGERYMYERTTDKWYSIWQVIPRKRLYRPKQKFTAEHIM